MTNEEIRRLRDERENLKYFLAQKGYNLCELERGLEPSAFSGFMGALSDMGGVLERAEMAARETRNVELVAILGAQARLQKDGVYVFLTESVGGGIPKIEGPIAALRDYVMQRYDKGLNKCERILAA